MKNNFTHLSLKTGLQAGILNEKLCKKCRKTKKRKISRKISRKIRGGDGSARAKSRKQGLTQERQKDVWEKTVSVNPGANVFNDKYSIWLKLRGDEFDLKSKKNELQLLRQQCIERFGDEPCSIINSVLPRYNVSKDIRAHNTICGLLYIIGIITEKLKGRCKIIIKGGLAIQFCISDIISKKADNAAFAQYYDILDNYSTKDIDLLLIPSGKNLHLCTFKTPTSRAVMSERRDADCAFQMRNGVRDTNCREILPGRCNEEMENGNTSLYYARQISDMIMWIFGGYKSSSAESPYKLSLLDLSDKPAPEEQIIKLSMITGAGYNAAVDININLPRDERFYTPLKHITHIRQDFISVKHNDAADEMDDFMKTGHVFSREYEPTETVIPIDLDLWCVSQKALIFDRIYHLYQFKVVPLDKIEALKVKAAMETDIRKRDGLWDEISRLNTSMNSSGNVYLSSIKRSLNVLIAADIIRSNSIDMSREKMFERYLADFTNAYNIDVQRIDSMSVDEMRAMAKSLKIRLTAQEVEFLDAESMRTLVGKYNMNFTPEQTKLLCDFLFSQP